MTFAGVLARSIRMRLLTGLLVGLALVGCDTVAELSISVRDFRSAATDGVVNANTCGADDSDVQVRLRFVPIDGDGFLIAPGEQVNDVVIDVGEGGNFSEQDVEFVSSVLYPFDDIECVNDGDCAAPFSCVAINPFNVGASRSVCGVETTVETLQRPLSFSDGEDDKSITIVMDYSADLGGQDDTGAFNPDFSIDRLDQRLSGAVTFVLGYSRSSFAADTEMCVVSFSGASDAGVAFLPTPNSCYTDEFGDINNRLNGLSVGEMRERPLWQAIQVAIAGANSPAFPPEAALANRTGDRALVVFTGGGDQSSTVDFSTALNTAVANDVAVHIIQLDNPQGGRPGTTQETVDQLTRMACATGGSYQLANSPNDLRNLFDQLSDTVPAGYQVDAQVIDVDQLNLEPACYRLATGVRITLANTQVTIQLAGDKTDPTTLQVIDDRLVVCRRPVPEAPEDNGDGGDGGDSQE